MDTFAGTLLLVIVGVLVLILGAVMASTLVGVVGALVLLAAGERAWRHRRDSSSAPHRRP